MTKRLTLEEMQSLAKARGGKCLSEEYTSAICKLEWQCKERHVWGATPHDIKRGHWCPSCWKIKIRERKQKL